MQAARTSSERRGWSLCAGVAAVVVALAVVLGESAGLEEPVEEVQDWPVPWRGASRRGWCSAVAEGRQEVVPRRQYSERASWTAGRGLSVLTAVVAAGSAWAVAEGTGACHSVGSVRD